MIEENKRIARAYLEALGRGDLEASQGLLAEDAQWIIPQDPDLSPLAGAYDKAGVARLLSGLTKVLPEGVKFTVIGETAEGDRVALEVVSQANSSAGPMSNRYHFLFVIRDGKIVLGKEYADSLYMKVFGERLGREAPR